MPRTIRTLRVAPLVIALSIFAAGPSAHAQTADELASARTLFTEALHDQDQKHFDVALEKFRRVQQVRDTAPVRYRIGMCQEGLGHLAQAMAAYQATAEMAAKDRAQDDVVKAARARMDALSRRVPRLSLSISGRSPSEVEVRIDDRRLTPESLKEAVAVDPGEHVISATAPGSKPFRTVVFLPEGGTAAIMIPLDGEGAGAATGQPATTPATTPAVDPNAPPPADKPASVAPQGGGSQRTAGAVVFVAGAALAIGGGVVYFMRRGEIASIHDSCPGDVCPASQRTEIEASRDRAALYGPLSAGLAIGGVAALGIGSYLFFTAPKRDASPSVAVVPLVTWDAAGLSMTGAF